MHDCLFILNFVDDSQANGSSNRATTTPAQPFWAHTPKTSMDKQGPLDVEAYKKSAESRVEQLMNDVLKDMQ